MIRLSHLRHTINNVLGIGGDNHSLGPLMVRSVTHEPGDCGELCSGDRLDPCYTLNFDGEEGGRGRIWSKLDDRPRSPPGFSL